MSETDFAMGLEAHSKRDVTRRSLRILVVDDNKPFAETLSQVLETTGDSVEYSYSGPAALEVAKYFNPDVVFLDIVLPVMDGYEVCKRLRGQSQNPALRVIAQSGYGDTAEEAEKRDACFDLHLVKPLDLVQLAQLLDDIRMGGAAPGPG